MKMKSFYLIMLLILSGIGSSCLIAQTSRVEFGKNRIQFHKKFKEWTYYEGDRTITYWYAEGRTVGMAAAQIAESEMNSIKDLLEHSINDKIEIIVYTDLTDLKQSNIGLEDAFEYTGGSTKILGNKIFVYFNGDHRQLRKQIREGIAGVYMESILFGSSLQEIVQNAVSFKLPDWFKIGLVEYAGEEWSVDADIQLKDILSNPKVKSFEHLVKINPALAGHAFWYYLSKNYGRTAVANLLYLVRINRSVDAGFQYVLGHDQKLVGENVFQFYKEKYAKETLSGNIDSLVQIKLPKRKNEKLSAVSSSKYTTSYAIATNQLGKVRIYLHDIEKNKNKLIYKKGFKNIFQAADEEYPHIAFSQDGSELYTIHEIRDKQIFGRYNLKSKKWSWEPVAPYFDRIHSMDVADKGRLVLSATVNGVSDLFLYYISTKQSVRITNDYFDDLDAKYAVFNNTKGIIFTSNRLIPSLTASRLDSIIPLAKMDVYFVEIDAENPKIIQLTNTPESDEASPVYIDSMHYSFLTDESGNWNRKTGYLKEVVVDTVQSVYFKDGTKAIFARDSLIPKIQRTAIDTISFQERSALVAFNHWNTNYNSTLFPGKSNGTKLIDYRLVKQRNKLVSEPNPLKEVEAPALTEYKQNYLKQWYIQQHANLGSLKIPTAKKTDTIAIKVIEKIPSIVDTTSRKKSAYFQSEFDDDAPKLTYVKPSEPLISEKPEVQVPVESKKYAIKNARIIPYRLAFRADYITTKLDNSPLFGGLDNYIGRQLSSAGNSFSYVPLGILVTTNFKDVLEDYIFEVGARFPTTFRGAEYFITFRDRKYRWDKSYSYYYSGQQSVIDPSAITPEYIKSLPKALQFQIPISSPIFPQFRTKVITNLVQFELKYPFDLYRSLRLRTTFRNDKMLWKATENSTLGTRNYNEQRLGQRIEFVFDNTLSTGLNLLNGTRYKIYTEFVKSTQIQIESPSSFDFTKNYLGIIGLDCRHYIPILKKSVLAMRLAGEISYGTNKMLYILGGVDNWLLPAFNNNIPLPTNQQFAYQTIATNLRGFNYNVRNGTSYGIFNAELRIPLFRYFSEKITSSFLRNFQLVGFFDAGTAWEGFTPFAKDNPINTIYLENPPTVKLKVNYYRDPVVAGFGFGARTSLLGYFVRADYGYGIETKVIGKPVFYLAFGTDF